MNEAQTARKRIMGVLTVEQTAVNIRDYFAEPVGGTPTYTGRLFERFGGGGDRGATAYQFTADDLLAVEALSVQVPPDVSFAMLNGSLGGELAELLSQIPTDVELGNSRAAEHLTSDSPASKAWALLEQQPGMGWVTAGKLLARKRPALIPVYDRVVRCVLGKPKSAWRTMNAVLADTEVRQAVQRLRTEAPAQITALRVVDVATWMHHHADHARGNCVSESLAGPPAETAKNQ